MRKNHAQKLDKLEISHLNLALRGLRDFAVYGLTEIIFFFFINGAYAYFRGFHTVGVGRGPRVAIGERPTRPIPIFTGQSWREPRRGKEGGGKFKGSRSRIFKRLRDKVY